MSRPERLLIFGDSLSDGGNAYALSGAVLKGPIPPESAGYNDWFSNGLIQSEVTSAAATQTSGAASPAGAALTRFTSRSTTRPRRR